MGEAASTGSPSGPITTDSCRPFSTESAQSGRGSRTSACPLFNGEADNVRSLSLIGRRGAGRPGSIQNNSGPAQRLPSLGWGGLFWGRPPAFGGGTPVGAIGGPLVLSPSGGGGGGGAAGAGGAGGAHAGNGFCQRSVAGCPRPPCRRFHQR